jgi:hypothetical protein
MSSIVKRVSLFALPLLAITLWHPAAGPALPLPPLLGSVPDPELVEEITPRFAEASSVLVPQLGGHGKNYFGPRKVMDNDWTTCWAEGVKGYGRDEWIRVVWLTEEVPKYVAVLPGWAKNRARWNNNPRLKDAEIQLSNGYMQQARFEDLMQLQFVELNSDLPAAWAQVVIRGVYAGKRFEDTSISEIKVYRMKK